MFIFPGDLDSPDVLDGGDEEGIVTSNTVFLNITLGELKVDKLTLPVRMVKGRGKKWVTMSGMNGYRLYRGEQFDLVYSNQMEEEVSYIYILIWFYLDLDGGLCFLSLSLSLFLC